jgi:predicted RNA-binding protein YlqC (UPF0109 family)
VERRKPIYFRNAVDLRDRVQVRILRRRLKLTDSEIENVVRKSGNSVAAIRKEAALSK